MAQRSFVKRIFLTASWNESGLYYRDEEGSSWQVVFFAGWAEKHKFEDHIFESSLEHLHAPVDSRGVGGGGGEKSYYLYLMLG